MNTTHLSEEMLQLIAMEGAEKYPSIKKHLSECSSCESKVKFYIQLVEKTESITASAFQFDVTSLVMAKIPEPIKAKQAERSSYTSVLLLIFIFISSTLAIYIFRKQILQLTKTSSEITLFIIAISGLTLLSFVTWDMFKEYENKVNKLNHQ